jgi:hypothetical protein
MITGEEAVQLDVSLRKTSVEIVLKNRFSPDTRSSPGAKFAKVLECELHAVK